MAGSGREAYRSGMSKSIDPAEGPTPLPRAVPAAAVTVPLAGAGARHWSRDVAVETGVEVAIGGVPFVVMMLTPADLEDFAYGFALTEGIVERADQVRGARVETEADGLRLLVDVAPDRMHHHLARRRAMSGRTGCGVCGIGDLAALERAQPPGDGAQALPVSIAAIARALAELPERQDLHRATGAAHAAAFADAAGGLLAVREDVGRHNAMDKLAGAVLRAGIDPRSGFVVVTSRCSFEMVEKTASLGARTLVAISAPTSLAIERARCLDVALVAVARADTLTIFHGAERILPSSR